MPVTEKKKSAMPLKAKMPSTPPKPSAKVVKMASKSSPTHTPFVVHPRPATLSEKIPARLQMALDKSEIAEVMYSYARGVDRMDETLLRSLFHADATIDLGPGIFQGTANDYVLWVLGVQQDVRMSHTMIGNIRAEVEGDAAYVESYFQIHHRIEKSTGREDLFLSGRFLNLMERRPSGTNGAWKIEHHKWVIDWTRTEAVSEIFYHQNPDALWGARGKGDASYFMRNFPSSSTSGKQPSFLGRRYGSKSIRL